MAGERRTKVLLCRWLLPHHFVVAMTTSLLLSFFCGYAIAVGSDKVNALFPYISDTGTKPPGTVFSPWSVSRLSLVCLCVVCRSFVCLSVFHLSVCLIVRLSLSSSVCLSLVCLSSVYRFVCPSVCLYVCLSVCRLSVCLSVCLSFCPSLSVSVRLCLSVDHCHAPHLTP